MTARKDRYAMPGSPPTEADLQHEVEMTRLELSRTVDRLADKLDVKAQARRRGQELMTFTREHRLDLIAGALATLTFLVVFFKHD
jgi:hypothetical protein